MRDATRLGKLFAWGGNGLAIGWRWLTFGVILSFDCGRCSAPHIGVMLRTGKVAMDNGPRLRTFSADVAPAFVWVRAELSLLFGRPLELVPDPGRRPTRNLTERHPVAIIDDGRIDLDRWSDA